MADTTDTLKSYELTITLADTQHPGLWWEPIEEVMLKNGYKKIIDPAPATLGPMHVTYSGVSYGNEADVTADIEKKLTAAGVGQISISTLKTGGTIER